MATAITNNLASIKRYEDVVDAAKPANKTANESMGQTEFLKLFTTQLQNQNPLDPVKNEAFVAQLAQFSQLEATTNMSTSLNNMVSSMSGERMLSGAALIGKKSGRARCPRNFEKWPTRRVHHELDQRCRCRAL